MTASLSSFSVFSGKKGTGEIVIFTVNRKDQSADLLIELQGFKVKNVIEEIVLEGKSLKAANGRDHAAVVPKSGKKGTVLSGIYHGNAPSFSWKMIRIAVNEE